jgi:hypothetical protein
VDEVKSFIRLRARGRRDGEALDEASELGEDVADLVGEGGDGVGQDGGDVVSRIPVTEEIVLQRFGQELRGEDEDHEDEDHEEDDDDDDEDEGWEEDLEDEYEMDFEQQVASRFKAPREYVEDFVDELEADVGEVEESDIDEEWSEPTDYSSRGVF